MMPRKRLCEVVKKKTYILEHQQIGIGMTVQLLPSLLHLKNLGANFFIKLNPDHVSIAKHFIDEDKIYPYKKIPADQNLWISDPVFGMNERHHEVLNTSMPGDGPYACHAVDFYFRRLHVDMFDQAIPMKLKNYPKFPSDMIDISKFNLPEKFVVISPTTTKEACIINRDEQLKINNYVRNAGYSIVHIGAKYDLMLDKGIDASRKVTLTSSDFKNDINLINKTSLPEAIAIMNKAKCFIGPEGGLMNMCGMTDTPMIIPFANMSPKTRMPYRHDELGWEVYPVIPDVECKFCVSRMTHRSPDINIMKECLYEDFQCLQEITFNKFKPYLDRIL